MDNNSRIKLEDVLMLLPTALRSSWIYQVLHFIVSWDISTIQGKVPDRKFSWTTDHECHTR